VTTRYEPNPNGNPHGGKSPSKDPFQKAKGKKRNKGQRVSPWGREISEAL